jgi:hypothetical protein
MAVRWVEDGMSKYEPGTDGYDTEDYGTAAGPAHDDIVAEWTVGSQARVVDTNGHRTGRELSTSAALTPYAGT